MPTKKTHTALRHIGIALIDLDYAILELTQAPGRSCARGAHRANIGALIEQRDRLRDFAAGLVDGMRSADAQDPCWARKWWPEFASDQREVGRSPSDGASV